MPELSAKVWRRYGKTRVYVNAAGDPPTSIGWYDPLTGRHDISDPLLTDAFWTTVTAECERLRATGKLDTIVLPGASPAEPAPGTDAVPVREPEPVSPPGPEPRPEPRAPASIPVADTPSPASEWHDLADRRPGEGVRDHARELRRANPLGSALARLTGTRTDARAFAEGARGERKVGRALDKYAARAGWYVLHGVTVSDRGTDIDHVVIGPFGVVTVNTKRTSGSVRVGDQTIWVSGHQVPYLAKSRAEARRAQQRLSAAGWDVPVLPALVFVGQSAFQHTHRRTLAAQDDVAVFPGPGALRNVLPRLPQVLDTQSVAALYATARRSDTWLA